VGPTAGGDRLVHEADRGVPSAAIEVVNDEQNALIYTDEELVFLINERLPTDRPCLGIQ